tara:strand:+ start:146 stop:307 length:162 start_codon:yes stop_codon:yes gene_type:complete
MFMIFAGALCGLVGFIELHITGAPIMGYVIAGSVACFVGGWAELARVLGDDNV